MKICQKRGKRMTPSLVITKEGKDVPQGVFFEKFLSRLLITSSVKWRTYRESMRNHERGDEAMGSLRRALVFGMAMVGGGLFASPQSAWAGTGTVTVGTVPGQPGQQVTVSVTANTDVSAELFELAVTYNGAVLTNGTVSRGALPNRWLLETHSPGPGEIRVMAADSAIDPITNQPVPLSAFGTRFNGEICRFTFTIAPTASIGAPALLQVTRSRATILDVSDNSMTLHVTDGAVNIDVPPPPPTLTATLTANPASGVAPLRNVSLTVTPGGTATGPWRVEFDCDTSTFSLPERVLDNLTSPSATASHLCGYAGATTVKTYTAAARVTRQGLPPFTATTPITVTPMEKVMTPVITPNGGRHDERVEVMLSSTTAGAQIRYTLDGSSDPTAATGVEYQVGTPILLRADTTVKARAFKVGMTDSDVATAVFDVNHPPVVSPITHNAVDADLVRDGLQVVEGTTVRYSGTVSDPDGDPVSWQWFYSLDGGLEFARPVLGTDPPTPVQDNVFTYPAAPKSYVWILRGNDGRLTRESRFLVEVVPPPIVLGDINGDRRRNLVDVRGMLQMLVGRVPVDLSRADMNLDGRLSLVDVRALLREIVNPTR